MQCQAWATTRSEGGSRFWQSYPCPHPARFDVLPKPGMAGRPMHDHVCGVRAREYRAPGSPWTATPMTEARVLPPPREEGTRHG